MEKKELSRAQTLAKEILTLSRNTLMVNFRFLDAALNYLEFLPVNRDVSLMTDGEILAFGARYVLTTFKNQKEAPTRNYLHMILHCIYRHMFSQGAEMDRSLWDLATDIAVENTINGFEASCVSSVKASAQQDFINAFKEECGVLTAEKIYRYLKNLNPDAAKVAEMRGYFYADDHELWYMSADEKKSFLGLSPDGNSDRNTDGNSDGNSDANAEGENARTEKKWKDISERMQSDIENFGKRRGTDAGNLMMNLKAINREKYDYTSFLKKFAVMGEAMKINDDEFDYIFYTYGLELYDRVPLIEPLEYKEVKRIKDFVIAIDTSGSVIGDEVQRFVQKTYNILKTSESYFSKVNIHIVQCDADIQEHVKITSDEEFENYIRNMKIYGLGGTDFRPVFTLVDKLIAEKEFTNLKGIIYFTDGYGVFPKKKPDYETAFVFVRDNYEIPEVPPWAIKLVLEKEELAEKF